jgi:alpha-tubulin suppressor-like RCC1 family protein
MAIKSNGSLWAWGSNNWGELGLDNTTLKSSPVQVGSDTDWADVRCGAYHTMAIKNDGTLWVWGKNDHGQLGLDNMDHKSSPVQVGSNTDWGNVACGDGYSMGFIVLESS